MTTDSHHVVPVKVYLAVFAALVVLTGVTTWVAFIDLGLLNVLLMLSIAIFKATLVILYFMHVRYSPRLTRIVVVGAGFWLAVMVLSITGDMLVRAGAAGALR